MRTEQRNMNLTSDQQVFIIVETFWSSGNAWRREKPHLGTATPSTA